MLYQKNKIAPYHKEQFLKIYSYQEILSDIPKKKAFHLTSSRLIKKKHSIKNIENFYTKQWKQWGFLLYLLIY